MSYAVTLENETTVAGEVLTGPTIAVTIEAGAAGPPGSGGGGGGSGTVTSVNASGGSTGLSFSGGPVTGAGTLTLAGTLDLDNGGTGATTAAAARTNLGLGTAATQNAAAFDAAGTAAAAVAAHEAAGDPHPQYVTTGELSGTLASYQPLDGDLTALAALTGTNTIYHRSAANTWTAVSIGTGLGFTGGTLAVTDAELVAIAGLASGADLAPYFTGSGTADLMTVTSFARSILDDANAAAVRATIGAGTVSSVGITPPAAGVTVTGSPVTGSGSITLALADDLAALEALTGTNTIYHRSGASAWTPVTIGAGLDFTGGTLSATGGGGSGAPTGAKYVTLGTDGDLTQERVLTAGAGIGITDGGAGSTVTVEVNDAELLAIAGLTSTADSLPYFTGSGTAKLATVTSFARSVLDDADAAAVRSTIGAGTGNGDALTSGTLAQFAATTSAQLRGVINDETGTGALVFATSPTLVTPTLGAAAATTINGLTLTTGTGTLTLSTFTVTAAANATVSGTNTGDQTITLSGAVAGSGTGAITATQVVQADRFVESPTNKTYVLTAKAAFAFTINEIRGLRTGSGTLTLAVQINGTNVTSLSGLSVTTTPQDVTATGANAVAAGDVITFVVSSASTPADLRFTLKGTR